MTVKRPLRLHSQFTKKTWQKLRFASGDSDLRAEIYEIVGESLFEDFDSIKKQVQDILKKWTTQEENMPARKITDAQKKRLLKADTWRRDEMLAELAPKLLKEVGDTVFDDHNRFRSELDNALKRLGVKLKTTDKKAIYTATSWRCEDAPPIIKKIRKKGTAAEPLRGLFETTINGKPAVVEYEPDTDLRDTEQIPLTEEGGIEAFIKREVLPYSPDAWYLKNSVKIGYEISLRVISTNRNRCERWMRSGRIFWRWSARVRDFWVR